MIQMSFAQRDVFVCLSDGNRIYGAKRPTWLIA